MCHVLAAARSSGLLVRQVQRLGVLSLTAFALLAAGPVRAVTIDTVLVGNPGNTGWTHTYPPNQGGTITFGAVNYEFRMGKYEVTVGQYAAFLNAVAATDTHALYRGEMATAANTAGIAQRGSFNAHTYSVIGSANHPVTWVSWWDAARFANWVANGQPTGAQNGTTTENGAYALNGQLDGTPPSKNAINPNTSAAPAFYIPSENEWFKAAYYSPALNGGSGGYYTYATQSDTAPGNVVGGSANQANYFTGVYSVTQSDTLDEGQNYLTDVGDFTGSASFYGTFDQSGNLWEWTDEPANGQVGFIYLRGGNWMDIDYSLQSHRRVATGPNTDVGYGGFRLAAPVPEPSAIGLALAGLACGGFAMWRRHEGRRHGRSAGPTGPS